MAARDLVSEETHLFTATIQVTQFTHHSVPSNSYGDAKPALQKPSETRQLLTIELSDKTLAGLQDKIEAHVRLID